MNITEVKKRTVSVIAVRILGLLKENVVFYAKEIWAFIWSFVLSFASLGGIRPFGVSFLCAYLWTCGGEKYKKGRICALLGVLFSSLFFENGVYSSVGALILAAVVLLWEKIGREDLAWLSPFLSSIAFLPCGVYGFFFAVCSIPLFSLAFSGLTGRGKASSQPLADGGFLCISFALTLVFKNVELGVLSFGIIIAILLCLEGCEKGGYFLGGLVGFFVGMALGTEYIPVFVLGSLAGGFFIRKKRAAGVFLLEAVGIVSSVAFGISGWDFIFSSLWGCALWFSLSELFLDKKRIKIPLKISSANTYSDKKLSEAIGNISLALQSVSKAKRREREEKVRLVVDNIFSAECETCAGCKLPTEVTKNRICKSILKNRKIAEADFSDNFREGCPRWNILKEKLNETLGEKPFGAGSRIETLAEDYMAMSRLLAYGEKKAESRYCRDVLASRKIRVALEGKNIRALNITVSGVRLPEIEITGIPFRVPFPEKVIKREVERCLEKYVSITSLETFQKTANMTLKAICPLKVEFYKISVPKKGEIICGDSISVFSVDDGYFYSVISDGMGSGRDAAVCSRLGTVFLEKLLCAGIDKAGAVSMLGNVVAASGDETFVTVDLMEIDLVRGKATFIKAGAASSWIIRNGRAYTVSSKTLPCGIISGTSAEQTVIDCFSGDIVIMASDGGEGAVFEAVEKMFSEGFLKGRTPTPKDIAMLLADAAFKKEDRGDDVTFCVVSVL